MALSQNSQGALLMMAGQACFTINDAFMKLMAGDVPLMQLLVLRGMGTVVAMAAIAWWLGMLHLRFPARDRWLVLARSAAEIGSTYFFLTALFHMPIANMSAIFQALPLAITLAGAMFLGETVGWRRLLAIVIGFCGVLLVVRPGTEGFNVYSLYALAAVACVVVRDLVVRRMSAEVPSLMVALGAGVAVTLFSGVASTAVDWVRPSGLQVGYIIAAGTFVVAGYHFAIATMRVGDLGFVAPFRYTGLLWALVLGLLVFGDWPDFLTILGSGIIVATGIFTLMRERRLRISGAAGQSATP